MAFQSILPAGARPPQTFEAACSVVPRPDLFKRVTSRSLYIATAPSLEADEGVLVEVTSVGPGRLSEGTLHESVVRVGDICWVNGAFAGRRVAKDGINHWTCGQERLLARQTKLTGMPIPLSDHLLTIPNNAWAQRSRVATSTKIERDGLPTIVVADRVDGEEGYSSDDDPRDPARVCYEEVAAVGPDAPEGLRVGSLIAFSRGRASTDLTVCGKKYCLVPMSCFSCLIATPEERPEGV